MQQVPLFEGLDAWKAAIAADVESAGGFKQVGEQLYPHLDPIKAQQRLSNACNPKQKQELDYHEVQTLKALARNASGASHIHAYESKALDCELHWVTQQERAERVAVRITDAVQMLQQTMTEAQELLRKLR